MSGPLRSSSCPHVLPAKAVEAVLCIGHLRRSQDGWAIILLASPCPGRRAPHAGSTSRTLRTPLGGGPAMARRFFYVAAGMLMLAMSYHLSADRATAQAGGQLAAIAVGGALFGVDQDGGLYSGEGCFGTNRPFARVGELPAGRTPTCMASLNNGAIIFIGCSNGDVFTFNAGESAPISPSFCGNLLSGSPTPAQRESWGQLKQRYAPNRGTARPGSPDR